MELGDIVTRVTLDATQFSEQMRRSTREMRSSTSLRKSIEDQFDIDNAANDFERNMVRINQRYRDTIAKLRAAQLTTQERGDLIDKATASHQAQVRQLERSVPRVRASSQSIAQQYQGMSRMGRNAMTQLAFATDDFFGVWQNSGSVGAAMRATSNNIGTLVTMLNPLAGIATTLAFAFGSSLVTSFQRSSEAANDFTDAMDKAIASAERAAEFRQEQRDFSGSPFEQRQEKLQTTEDQLAVAEAEMQEAEQQLRKITSEIGKMQSDFQTLPFPLIGPVLFDVQKWWHGAGSEVTEQQDNIRKRLEEHREEVERLRKEYERLEQLDTFRRGGESNTAARNAMIAFEIAGTAGLLGATRGGELSTDDAVRERKALERDEKRMAREREKRERERQQRAEDFRDTQLDIQSQLLTGRERREFDINRRFDEQRDRIFATAPSIFDALSLAGQNEQARQKALEESRQAAGGPRFAGQFQQGSAEAFSEILRASGVADDQAKKAAKATADNTKNTADQTKAIADQLRLADSLLLIPSLGGAG